MTGYDAIKLTDGCTAPWKSLDACSTGRRARRARTAVHRGDVIDSTDMILKCFNCEKDECDNCHERRHSTKRAIRMKEARETFTMYYCTGFSKSQICEIMRISLGTYERYIRKFIKGRKN